MNRPPAVRPGEAIRRSSIHLDDYSPISNLEDWDVQECIGQGSFGVIHKVQRKSNGYIAAMKQLDYSKLSPKDRRQMVEEVRILGSLRNKHVVQLIDKIMDTATSRCFIIMEFCGGGDLGKILDRYRHRGKSIPEHIVWNYFIQLTQALHHCHHPEDRHLPSSSSSPSRISTSTDVASGIPGSSFERKSSIVPGREMGLRRKLDSLDISPGGGDPLGLGLGGGAVRRRMDVKASAAGQVLHRDLKPENIFLDADDNIKLGDFGLSKNLVAGAFTQTYVGTPLYMPPEILKESKYDHKSDIWSLGCLVYELCTLSSPFASAKSQTELLSKVMHSKWTPIGPAYSSGLRDLVTRMLSIDPARRPSTRDLQNSLDMKHWKKEQDRQRVKAEQDRIAAELEKKVDQLVAIKEAIITREKACAAKEQAFSTREQACVAKEQELIAQQEHIQAVWRQEQDSMSAQRAQLNADFEKMSQELQEDRARIQARQAELTVKEKNLASRERELVWGRRELEAERADLETAMTRWKTEKATASGSDVKLPERSKSAATATVSSGVNQVAARPPLQERSTVPNVVLNTSKPRKSSPLNNPSLDFMDLDSPARGHFASASPSLRSGIPRASPRSDAFAKNGTPLRPSGRLATKSFNDLRARAKLDAESVPSSPVPGGNDSFVMMDLGTPVGQIRSRSHPNDFSGEPGFDLDKLQTTNSAKLNQSLAEAARPDCNDIDLLFSRGEGKQTDFGARLKLGRPALNHANTTIAGPRISGGKVSKIPLPTADFIYKENATPAKWSLSDDDVPSPFLKQTMPSRPILTGTAAGSPTPRERIMPRSSGHPDGGFRPTSTRNLLKVAIKNRQSGEMMRPEGLTSPSASTVDRLL